MRHEAMAPWRATDDELILECVERYGPRWSKIALELPGRSVASVRNRYLRIQKGMKKRLEGSAKNRCHACGQMKLGHVCHARDAGGPFVVKPPPVRWLEPSHAQTAAELVSLFSRGATDMQSMSPTTQSTATPAVESQDEGDVESAQSSSSQSCSEDVPLGASEVDGIAASALPTSSDDSRLFVNLSAVPSEVPPALCRRPSQEEMAAHRVLLLKKNLAVRAQFAL